MQTFDIYQLAKILDGKIIREDNIIEKRINGVSIDTRNIKKGQLFIPIIGENFDGHNFIDKAYELGANVCLTSDANKLPNNNGGILVEDTKKALQRLAIYVRQQFNKPVIAITGSVGKTSCKEMLASILSTEYKVHKTKGNYNNDIGLPLTILDIEEDADVAILEMGMNHFGEIDLLASIARPDYGIITNIGVSHIENLGSRDGILQAKSEMIPHINQNGLIALNGDDNYLEKLVPNLIHRYALFGFSRDLDYYVVDCKEKGLDGTDAIIISPHGEYNVTINAIGTHMLYHALSGIVIAENLGITTENILRGISDYQHEKMRLNKLQLNNGIIVINDAYNASVDSMKAALSLIKNSDTQGRKITILGDMFEMGDYAEEGHKEVGAFAADSDLDLLICVGNSSRWIKEAATESGFLNNKCLYFDNQDKLLDDILHIIKPFDTILVKASRGMQLERTVEKIKEVN